MRRLMGCSTAARWTAAHRRCGRSSKKILYYVNKLNYYQVIIQNKRGLKYIFKKNSGASLKISVFFLDENLPARLMCLIVLNNETGSG